MSRALALAAVAVLVAAGTLLWLMREKPETPRAPMPRDAAVAQRSPAPRLADAAAVVAPVETPAAIHGRLTERGKPVPKFEVGVREQFAADFTDEAGEFRIEGVLPGRHVVIAEDRTTGRRAVHEVTVAAGNDAEVNLELAPTGKLEIEVVDSDGAPVGGALVALTGEGAAASYFATKRMETDKDGRIDRLGVTTGPVTVIAVAGGRTVSENLLAREDTQRVRIAFDVRGGLAIEGRVVDDRGVGIGDIEVSLHAGASSDKKTDRAGRFRFERLLAGTYAVTAGGMPDLAHQNVDAGTRDLVLTIPRNGHVEGTVDAPDFISIHLEGGKRTVPTMAKDGHFEVDAPPGHYRIVASVPNGNPIATAETELRPGETTTVHLHAGTTGSVRIVATSFGDSAPVAGIVCGAKHGVARATTDEHGETMLDQLPAGDEEIVCIRGHDVVGRTTVKVDPRAAHTVRLAIVSGDTDADAHRIGADVVHGVFANVEPDGPAATAGIANGDELLAVDGIDATGPNADAAALYVQVHKTPFRVRVRSKGATYAVDLTVTPR
ncbi:MAG: carboxypeptidase regulatory-like domain-containing protein [Deltaproteobacteria bacterium]|nr:carboxypeptidase regulatory-like domain-containing protein [Deltaproteobacteria bacterium]